MSPVQDPGDILAGLAKGRTIIICIGNTLKGDDGAAIELYSKLASNVKAEVIDAGTVPEGYIQRIVTKAPDNILIVDAVDFSGPAGAIRIFAADEIPAIACSTHVMSLRFFIDSVKQDSLANIHLLGIQPQQVGLGTGLSDSVAQTVAELAELLIEVFGSGELEST
jgi:hydrogenase 3 maturation protease